MASYFFLRGEFENVMIYFTSIKGFFFNDDSFNFNFAQAKAILGSYAEAEEVNNVLCMCMLPTLLKRSKHLYRYSC